MSRKLLFLAGFSPVLLGLAVVGCSAKPSAQVAHEEGDDHGHEHAHPSEGPHGGSLIELGNEEYHAELVHDDATGTITIYVLDSTAKAAVPIEATDITLNLTHEGKGEQFKLAASPAAGEAAGKASQFASTDAELAKELDHEHAEAELVVTINGKPYRGKVEHHHGHEGEDEHGHKDE